MTGKEAVQILYCQSPTCSREVPTDPPYWTTLGKFYCSEYCSPMSKRRI